MKITEIIPQDEFEKNLLNGKIFVKRKEIIRNNITAIKIKKRFFKIAI